MNYIREYYKKICNNDIKTSEKIRNTYKYLNNKLENDGADGYFFSEKKAMRIIKFAENFCTNSKGKYGGKLVKLELWEKAMLSAVS